MKLKIDAICLISSIIDKIQIDDKFMDEMFAIANTAKGKDKATTENIQKKIGMKIILKLSSKMHLVRDELVKFIATYKEISEEEAVNVDIVEIVKELMKDKEFTSFLKQKVMSE